MVSYNRREFLQMGAVAAAATGTNMVKSLVGASKPLRLGLLVNATHDPEKAIAEVSHFGIPTAHVSTTDLSPAMARRLRAALERNGVEATALLTSGPGPEKYDLYEGPLTYGLVPGKYRRQRIDRLKRASDFARQVGVTATFNQWGFIPEVPSNELYEPTVDAVREVARHCQGNGQIFFNETGQETPITLLRTIEDAGMDNVRVVLDAANLILYGKGNPVDSIDVIGKYVAGVHAKGGFYPTNPRFLGRQVAAGHGEVDWPRLIQRLKQIGYTAPITIEPVLGPSLRDHEIREDMSYLDKLIGQS